MVTRNETLPDPREEETAPRQRSARTDAALRDGDSGRGNPYESDGDDPTTTDRDVGDTGPTDLDAEAAEVVTTPASTPEAMEDTFGDEDEPDDVDEKRASPRTATDDPGPAGASAKRREEYAELRDEFKEEGRYPGREEEVAARIVNKQRREFGETKDQKADEKTGRSPDADLPVARYQHLTVPQIVAQAEKLGHDELQQLLKFERSHRRRKTLITKMERLAKAAGKNGTG